MLSSLLMTRRFSTFPGDVAHTIIAAYNHYSQNVALETSGPCCGNYNPQKLRRRKCLASVALEISEPQNGNYKESRGSYVKTVF